ncbi:hypothetical protein CKAH01_15179 [Colletotrichum kahawae]|uniref:Uncharacterized protein n=1 Tax=Colletotrichum kahawae TaxID=34407 RepID=A0AAE0D8M5_COLKA|nr:hypothetical protein CKAH01_15179 [Colletotrichum kahawae]
MYRVKTLSGWRGQISTVGTRGKHRVRYSFASQLGWTWTWLSSAACCFIWRYLVLPQLGRLALFFHSRHIVLHCFSFFSFWVIGITGRGSGDRSMAHLQGGLQGNCVVGSAMSRPAIQIQYTSRAQVFLLRACPRHKYSPIVLSQCLDYTHVAHVYLSLRGVPSADYRLIDEHSVKRLRWPSAARRELNRGGGGRRISAKRQTLGGGRHVSRRWKTTSLTQSGR